MPTSRLDLNICSHLQVKEKYFAYTMSITELILSL